jgi:hypothetical protein
MGLNIGQKKRLAIISEGIVTAILVGIDSFDSVAKNKDKYKTLNYEKLSEVEKVEKEKKQLEEDKKHLEKLNNVRYAEFTISLVGILLQLGRIRYFTPQGVVATESGLQLANIIKYSQDAQNSSLYNKKNLMEHSDSQCNDGIFTDLSKIFAGLTALTANWAGKDKDNFPSLLTIIAEAGGVATIGALETWINKELPTQADLEIKKLDGVIAGINNLFPLGYPKDKEHAKRLGYEELERVSGIDDLTQWHDPDNKIPVIYYSTNQSCFIDKIEYASLKPLSEEQLISAGFSKNESYKLSSGDYTKYIITKFNLEYYYDAGNRTVLTKRDFDEIHDREVFSKIPKHSGGD